MQFLLFWSSIGTTGWSTSTDTNGSLIAELSSIINGTTSLWYTDMIQMPTVRSFFSNNTRYILGFNEPNIHAASNVPARLAAEEWRNIERHSHGAKLVSPSASPCNKTGKCISDVFDWFDEFFRICNGCRVDFIATHMYVCNADQLMSYLQSLYHKYHKKIWLTEFACPHTKDPNVQLRYMKEVLPRLEAAHYIYR